MTNLKTDSLGKTKSEIQNKQQIIQSHSIHNMEKMPAEIAVLVADKCWDRNA